MIIKPNYHIINKEKFHQDIIQKKISTIYKEVINEILNCFNNTNTLSFNEIVKIIDRPKDKIIKAIYIMIIQEYLDFEGTAALHTCINELKK